MATVQHQDIVGVATVAGRFSTLATALQATGLDQLLQGDGPFTVFAPTDAAFARLPKGLLQELLQPASRDRLAAILTGHIVPGAIFAAELTAATAVTTLQGRTVPITSSRAGLTVGHANLVTPDLDASNGVIHVIDGVLLTA